MPTIFMRGVLFFCSYSPLTLIVSILLIGTWPWWGIALLFGIAGVGSLLLTRFYFRYRLRKGYVEHKKVTNFTNRDGEVMSYIASYLIPFVAFSLESWQKIVAQLVFIVVLLVIYVHSNMIYINPVLNMCGYHLYDVEVEQSTRSRCYIARKPLERGHEIHFVVLSNDVYLEK